MLEGSQENRYRNPWAWAQKAAAVFGWISLGLLVFFSALGGMAANGCFDPGCEGRITRAWLALMAFQLVVIVAAVRWARKADQKVQLLILGGLSALSLTCVILYLVYADSVTI